MTRDQVVKEVVTLRAAGITWPEVERKFNIPRKRLMRWLKTAGQLVKADQRFFIKQELLDRYKLKQLGIAELVTATGQSAFRIRGELLRRGVSLHGVRSGNTKDRTAYWQAVVEASSIVRQYTDGKTLNDLSREFRIAPVTVRALLLKNNVTLRKPGPVTKQVDPLVRLAGRYGVSVQEITQVIDRAAGRCMACGAAGKMYGNGKSAVTTQLCIDHCHTTGKIRGVLCRRCNVVLGLVYDKREPLDKLVNYLETTNGVR